MAQRTPDENPSVFARMDELMDMVGDVYRAAAASRAANIYLMDMKNRLADATAALDQEIALGMLDAGDHSDETFSRAFPGWNQDTRPGMDNYEEAREAWEARRKTLQGTK